MNSEKDIKNKINEIRENGNELYSFLYKLIKNKFVDALFLEEVYRGFLEDERQEVKAISIYGLLFGLKIRKQIYRDIALSYILDPDSGYDLKTKAISGIGTAYSGTKDKVLLTKLYNLFLDNQENEEIRTTCFKNLLKLLGLSSEEIFFRNKDLMIEVDDLDVIEFSKEIKDIERIIQS